MSARARGSTVKGATERPGGRLKRTKSRQSCYNRQGILARDWMLRHRPAVFRQIVETVNEWAGLPRGTGLDRYRDKIAVMEKETQNGNTEESIG